MRLSKLFSEFIESEKSGGLIFVLMTILSPGFAYSPWRCGIDLGAFNAGKCLLIHQFKNPQGNRISDQQTNTFQERNTR
jgi:hypothetical protein